MIADQCTNCASLNIKSWIITCATVQRGQTFSVVNVAYRTKSEKACKQKREWKFCKTRFLEDYKKQKDRVMATPSYGGIKKKPKRKVIRYPLTNFSKRDFQNFSSRYKEGVNDFSRGAPDLLEEQCRVRRFQKTRMVPVFPERVNSSAIRLVRKVHVFLYG